MRRAETIMRKVPETVTACKSGPARLAELLGVDGSDLPSADAKSTYLWRELMRREGSAPLKQKYTQRKGAIVSTATRQRSGRAPRRAVRTVARVASGASAGSDGPAPPEPPPSRAGQSVSAHPPIGGTITDLDGFARQKPRAFRETVKRKGIPYAIVGRRIVVRLDTLLAALGLAPRVDVAPATETRESARLRLVASLTAGSKRGSR